MQQLQGEVARLEAEASAVSQDVCAAEAVIAQSASKQQALALHRTIEELEAEKRLAIEEQEQLRDPAASSAALQNEMASDAHGLEAKKAEVRELQAAVKAAEGRLTGLKSAGPAGGRCVHGDIRAWTVIRGCCV